MSHAIKEPKELQSIYERRFTTVNTAYRSLLWQTLNNRFFQRLIRNDSAVMDLGCGYGEFINGIKCKWKYGMDLNPSSSRHLSREVMFYQHDCTKQWPIEPNSLDVVFTSNFFEHLPDKLALRQTLLEAHRCLKEGGIIIALGPNIKHVNGAYWDFWDHFLCLTEKSLREAMEINGFQVVVEYEKFLPYTTINQPRYPMALVKWYLALPFLWNLFGKQFLLIGKKATGK